MRDTTKTTMKKKKQSRAISEAPAAIPPKPNTAAMIATMKNPSDHLNMENLHSSIGIPNADLGGRDVDPSDRTQIRR